MLHSADQFFCHEVLPHSCYCFSHTITPLHRALFSLPILGVFRSLLSSHFNQKAEAFWLILPADILFQPHIHNGETFSLILWFYSACVICQEFFFKKKSIEKLLEPSHLATSLHPQTLHFHPIYASGILADKAAVNIKTRWRERNTSCAFVFRDKSKTSTESINSLVRPPNKGAVLTENSCE